MAEACFGVAKENDSMKNSREAGRRRLEMRQINVAAGEGGSSSSESDSGAKRCRCELVPNSLEVAEDVEDGGDGERKDDVTNDQHTSEAPNASGSASAPGGSVPEASGNPKFGAASVCGRRRDMEDAVAIHPSLMKDDHGGGFHFFAVFDGHGCSHVATKCKERMHEIVEEEIVIIEDSTQWKSAMERSFLRMNMEVLASNASNTNATCRCELQSPRCDAVGSTAVVAIITPDKIVVANCGDSRAVLCRGGKPVPLTDDHKPDRPDELMRIEAAGGRVIYWDGARVLGVLGMSRAIGDDYLKPFVTYEPEVTVMDTVEEDEFLILASDGLWDVVANDVACEVARTSLQSRGPPCSPMEESEVYSDSDKACSDAASLLAKLALSRRSYDNVSVVVVQLGKFTNFSG